MTSLDQLWAAAVACKPEDGPTTAMLATFFVVIMIPKLRKLVWDTVETVLASALLLLLIGMVLGLPFGATYIVFKGAMFVLKSLAANFPAVRDLAALAVHQFTG